MIKPDIPLNENKRIKALQELNILDTIEEDAYDQLTSIASQICDVPISLVSLIDSDRQWFKSHHGLDARETPREIAFCAHAINNPDKIMMVENAREDIRFHDNPLATGAPDVIFYAGAPLKTSEGFCLGTLCVIDNKPNTLNDAQKQALKALADQVIAQLELRKKNLILNEKIKLVEQLNQDIDAFSYRLSHDIQTPMRSILSIIDYLRDENADEIPISLENMIIKIENRAKYAVSLVKSTIDYAAVSKANLTFSAFTLEDCARNVFENSINSSHVKLKMTNCNRVITTSEYAIQVTLQNLMTNSEKYNDKETCLISISCQVENNKVFIDYKDNGPGINSKYTAKIFEIFETLESKSENSTGLGLAMIKTVLNKLNGTIRLVDNQQENGVHFKIELPLETLRENLLLEL